MRIVYDGFSFLNELDLLEIRLNELKDVVDYHIIVEADETHSGNKKPYNLEENAARFEKWWDKIIYLKIDGFPSRRPEERDIVQRMCIGRGVGDEAGSDSIIIISDLDEIPRSSSILEAIDNIDKTGEIQCLESQLYFYGLNYRCTNYPIWPAPMISRIDKCQSPQHMRNNAGNKFNRIKNGGWHYSYCGSLENIKYKISSYTHFNVTDKPEINTLDNIQKCIDNGVSIVPGCDRKFERIILDYQNSPKYLVDNIDKFKHLLV